MRFRSTRTPGTGSGFRPAILFLLVAMPGLPLLHGQSAPIPALTGVASNASVVSGLTVDGRHILLSKDTDFNCSTVSGSFTVQSGVPVFPPGSSVAVFGKWDKQAEAYRASSVCLQKMPDKTVSGASFIDAVKPGLGNNTLVYADGRALTLPNLAAPVGTIGTGQPVLTMTPPLNAGAPPVAGEWLQYHAERSSDGSLRITQGVVHDKLKTRMSDNFRAFQPATFVIPTTGAPGKLKVARIAPTYILPYDSAVLDRLAAIGGSVIPPWQKQLTAKDSEKVDFRFYEAEKLPVDDCVSFPDGIIFVSKKTVGILTVDSDLAGLLAGCVAEVTNEQAAQYFTKTAANSGISIGAAITGAFVPGVGLIALGDAAYNTHEQHIAEEAAARVAVNYLVLASYPPDSGASAWEKLEGKTGR